MHPFDVRLQLLRLTEFPATEITNRTRTIRIRGTSVGPMHLQVVESQEELATELALVGTLPIMLLRRMLHDVVLAQYRFAANLTVVLPDGQTHRRIMEDGAVGAVVQRMLELQVTATAIYFIFGVKKYTEII